MNLKESLEKSDCLMRTIDAKMAGTNISGEPRNRIFSALLHLSLEHFGSVTQLVKTSCTGSAAALLRPQYEALIRGIYVQDCATENQIEQLLSGKEFPKFAVMIKALEEKAGSTNSSLLRLYEVFKKTLHGFTHGGLEQIQRRFSGADLINSFEEAEKIQLLQLSYVLAQVAATSVAAVAGRDELLREFSSGLINNVARP